MSKSSFVLFHIIFKTTVCFSERLKPIGPTEEKNRDFDDGLHAFSQYYKDYKYTYIIINAYIF